MDGLHFRWAKRSNIIALTLLLSAGVLWAQNQSRLVGTVTDSSGAAIPGARLTLSHVATGVETNSESNESGASIFPYVAPDNSRWWKSRGPHSERRGVECKAARGRRCARRKDGRIGDERQRSSGSRADRTPWASQ